VQNPTRLESGHRNIKKKAETSAGIATILGDHQTSVTAGT